MGQHNSTDAPLFPLPSAGQPSWELDATGATVAAALLPPNYVASGYSRWENPDYVGDPAYGGDPSIEFDNIYCTGAAYVVTISSWYYTAQALNFDGSTSGAPAYITLPPTVRPPGGATHPPYLYFFVKPNGVYTQPDGTCTADSLLGAFGPGFYGVGPGVHP